MTTFTREDYEMAAKAAGYAIIGDLHPSDGVNVVIGGRVYLWRPSDEDGDAFRLANRLRICVEFGSCEDDAPVIWVGLIEDRRDWPRCAHFPDPNAATRHAIFRAAIAIGRAMS